MKQQCPVHEVGVFVEEGFQPLGVGGCDTGGSFDLNGQQPVWRFNNEIHFDPRSRAPVEHFGAARLQITPGQKVCEHQVFQMRPSRFALPGQKEGKPRVAPVELGRLDKPEGSVHGIGGKANGLIARLHEVEEAVDLRLGDPYVAPQFGLIDEVADTQAGRPHEAAKIGEVLDRTQGLQIPLQISLHITGKPESAIICADEAVGRDRQTAQNGGSAPIFCRNYLGIQHLAPSGERRCEKLTPCSGTTQPQTLAPGEGPESDIHRAAGQGFTYLLQHQQVGRACEHETAWGVRRVCIYGAFDSDEQVTGALHLIEDHTEGSRHHSLRFRLSLDAQVEVVQSQIRPPFQKWQ